MRNDTKSNTIIGVGLTAISRAAGQYNTPGLDHGKASSASYLVDVGDKGAAGTLAAKLQYSDDDAAWTDYPVSDPMGNDSAITTIIANGFARLHVTSARGRYSRVSATVAVNAVVFGVSYVTGPLRSIDV